MVELSLLQKRVLWNSLSDLQPYIEDYEVVFHICPTTYSTHADIVITFKNNIKDSKIIFSEQFRNLWGDKFDKVQLVSDKVLKFIRTLPTAVTEKCFPNSYKFHHEGDWSCYDVFFR